MFQKLRSENSANLIIVVLIILLSLTFITLLVISSANYLVNRSNVSSFTVSDTSSTVSAQVLSSPQDRKGRIDEGGIQVDRREENTNNEISSGHSTEGYQKSLDNQQRILDEKIWEATNYAINDIVSKSFTVQLGDTLWEIAEAYYGDGFKWTDILVNNSSTIGFLPDGEQALITPGQILLLP